MPRQLMSRRIMCKLSDRQIHLIQEELLSFDKVYELSGMDELKINLDLFIQGVGFGQELLSLLTHYNTNCLHLSAEITKINSMNRDFDISELSLSDCDLNEERLASWFNADGLRKLILHECGEQFFATLSPRRLTHLQLTSVHINNTTFDLISANSGLKDLRIANSSASGNISQIGKLQQLERFFLVDCILGPDILIDVLPFSACKSLEFLDLTGTSIRNLDQFRALRPLVEVWY